MKKVRALYYDKEYNAFAEYNKGNHPYEIVVDVPANWSNSQIRAEANKGIKEGYFLKSVEAINE